MVELLQAHWPNNRAVNLIFHGHSVPSGYFATPLVDTFHAYPHLLHRELKQRFPYAHINAITTAIGGENAERGAARFESEVLCHRPDVICIDYALNDRRSGLEAARNAWTQMIQQAKDKNIPVILLTPTWDITQLPDADDQEREALLAHAEQVRQLADEYDLGLADSSKAFAKATQTEGLQNFLSWSNHPNQRGHQLVADELAEWFPPFIQT